MGRDVTLGPRSGRRCHARLGRSLLLPISNTVGVRLGPEFIVTPWPPLHSPCLAADWRVPEGSKVEISYKCKLQRTDIESQR